MLKIYGSHLCPDCVDFKANLDAYGYAYEFLDITTSLPVLKEFLKYRDTDPQFESVRSQGKIGIPFYVEDGRESLDWEGYLTSRGKEVMHAHMACSKDGKGC